VPGVTLTGFLAQKTFFFLVPSPVTAVEREFSERELAALD
jgi:hypothetical protein